jgi:hypothetical protein
VYYLVSIMTILSCNPKYDIPPDVDSDKKIGHGTNIRGTIFNNLIKDDGTFEKNGWLIDFDFGGKCI